MAINDSTDQWSGNEVQHASHQSGTRVDCCADAVVMIEDTVITGNWLEVRKSLQSGENVILK